MKFMLATAVALLAIFGSIESYSIRTSRSVHKIARRSAEIVDKVKKGDLKAAYDELDIDEDVYNEIEEYCPNSKATFNASVTSFVKCIDNIGDDKTLCEGFEEIFTNCTHPLELAVDSCLPAKSKGIVSLAIKSVVSGLKLICGQSGELNFEILNPCYYEDIFEDSSEEKDGPTTTNSTADALESSIKSKMPEEAPSKQDLCGFVTSFRDDLADHVKESCKSPKTNTAVMGFYDAIVSPCNDIQKV